MGEKLIPAWLRPSLLCLILPLLLLLLWTLPATTASSTGSPPPEHYNVIFIGATGDLARKYLWRALYALFRREHRKGLVHFTVYGAARTNQAEGRQAVSDILLKVIQCHDGDCRRRKTEFIESVQYHALRKEGDYKALATKISENTLSQYGLAENQTSYERGRLFYLSVPPSALSKMVRLIKEHLMPQAGRPWVRLLLEKPFGRDGRAAKKLATHLEKFFHEEQLYRVDHYLGKPVTRLVLPFRHINRQAYEPLWNRHHVARVEVVMKETLDCQGRLDFYDEVGVVRDVMQNHLTELLLLVAMELPANSGNITEILLRKRQALRTVKPVHEEGVVYGQYADYQGSARVELGRLDYHSRTPTFAAALLYLNSARWRGVPFVLMSGKQMDEKSSHIRVVFKDNVVCADAENRACSKSPPQVVFHLATGRPERPPAVLVSPGLPRPGTAQVWRQEVVHLNASVFGEPLADMVQLLPTSEEEEAYDALLMGAFHGQRHLFTNADILRASWELWTPVVDATSRRPLKLYDMRDPTRRSLDVQIAGPTLKFTNHDHFDLPAEPPPSSSPTEVAVDGTFLSHPAVTGDLHGVLTRLSRDIRRAARRAVDERGAFHWAVSGGSSPLQLYRHLAAAQDDDDDEGGGGDFPWLHTHLWQVDERCVSMDSVHSNLGALNSYLLRQVPVPFHHVHPLQPLLREEPCQDGDEADLLYEHALRRSLPELTFDLVLLGLGADGHTASLFPHQPSLSLTDRLAVYSSGGSDRRLTVTFELINRARNVGVLVTGKSKRAIVEALKKEPSPKMKDYPIVGVQPSSGNMTFYMDEVALGKND